MLAALPPVFAGLEMEDSQEAAGFLQPLQLAPNEVIMEQGEEDLTLAFVTQGSISLYDGELRIGGAGRRDMLGEIELFSMQPRVATAICTGPVNLQVLAYEHYQELCNRGNPAVYNIERTALRRISERLRWFNDGIAERTRGTPFELHPASKGLLARLTERFRRRSQPDLDPSTILAASPLFGWADGSVLVDMASHFEVARFDAEQLLCRQGEPGERMFIIAEGKVDVVLMVGSHAAETIATLGPGQAFGDASMAQGSTRSASCVCHEEVVALTMDRKQYLELYAVNDPAGSVFRQGMVKNLITQLLAAQQRYVELESKREAKVEEEYRGTPVSTVWRD